MNLSACSFYLYEFRPVYNHLIEHFLFKKQLTIKPNCGYAENISWDIGSWSVELKKN